MRRAYVTLVTNADFATGAAALLRSLRETGTTADLVVLHTAAVPDASLRALEARGGALVAVDLLPTSAAFNERHARDRIHRDRAVFLDADTLVLRPIDRLFDYPELCAAPNVYESLADFHRMNSGVFTARPDPATFDRLMGLLDAPGAHWPRTDQTFLQSAFPGWHGLPVLDNLLQYVWLNLPALWSWEDVRVVHYQYEKPWTDHAKADALRPLVDLWRAYAGDGPIPDLSALPPP